MSNETQRTLHIDGLTELDIAELRKALASLNISFDEVSHVDYQRLPEGAKLGDPGTAQLVIELVKFALPVVSGVLAGWLAKGRAKHKRREIYIKTGKFVLRRTTSDDLVEEANPEATKHHLEQFVQGET